LPPDGFRNARIQTICRRAGANIAAAHYHFGDKEGLYPAVFDYAEARAMRELRPTTAPTPPAERLREHITSFLARTLDPDRPAWFARLLGARDDRPDAGARRPGAAAHARHPSAPGGDHPDVARPRRHRPRPSTCAS
jgi:AcrR family transcriptional regulator